MTCELTGRGLKARGKEAYNTSAAVLVHSRSARFNDLASGFAESARNSTWSMLNGHLAAEGPLVADACVGRSAAGPSHQCGMLLPVPGARLLESKGRPRTCSSRLVESWRVWACICSKLLEL